jgi:hypothetical protein
MKLFISLIATLILFSSHGHAASIDNSLKGRLKRIITYSSPSKDNIMGMVKFSYNKKGLKDTVYNYFNDTNTLFSCSAYEYAGPLVKAEKYFLNQSGKLNQKYSENYYYSNNLLTQKEHIITSNSKVLTRATYNIQEGRIISEKTIQLDPFYIVNQVQHTYDSKGNETETKYLNENGEVISTVIHTYLNQYLISDNIFESGKEYPKVIIYSYDTQNRLLEKNILVGTRKYLLQKNKYNDLGIAEIARYSYDDAGYSFDSLEVYEYY